MKRLLHSLFLFLAIPAVGQNYFTNSSFELPSLGGATPGNPFTGWESLTGGGDGQLNGWTWQGFSTQGGIDSSGGGLTTQGNWLSPQNAPDGTQLAFIVGNGRMAQTIQIPSNGLYQLSFWVGTTSPYFSTENFTLQVNGTSLNRWTAAFLGNTKMTLIQTNIVLTTGANTIAFIGDTNGATAGQQGYGLNFDLIQSGPYFAGFTFNDTTLTANSDGSYVGTVNALAHAAQNGNNGWYITVGTNGGSYQWPSAMSFSVPNMVTLAGASSTNRTSITFTNTGNDGIYMNCGSYETLRDFIFNSSASGPLSDMVAIDGSNVCFRVANCQFLNTSVGQGTACGIRVCPGHNATHFKGPWGLIDHTDFILPGGPVYNVINCHANGTADNWCWSNNMTWGTTNSVVIENVTSFQPEPVPLGGFVEADGGARVCIRYCNITNCPESTHGMASGSGNSTLQLEAYENNFVYKTATLDQIPYWFLQRGGTAVIFSNNFVNQLNGGSGALDAVFEFWNECAGTNSAFQNFIPSGAAYSGAGFYTITITNFPTVYQFWGGIHDTAFGFGTNPVGAASASYTAIANNTGGTFGTNVNYLYLKGTASATVTVGVRDVSQDNWYQEPNCRSDRQFYPTNYPSWEQIGQGSTNNQITTQPMYLWSNNVTASLFGSWILGHDSGDAPFIVQGRDVFTNTVMPGYNALVYPSPQDITPIPPVPPPVFQTLVPLGNLGAMQNLH